MWKNKSKNFFSKNYVILIGVLGIFFLILYLPQANKIYNREKILSGQLAIASYIGKTSPYVVNLETQAYFNWVKHGKTQNMSCAGWSYTPNNNLNKNRKVKLVLQSEEGVYEADLNFAVRDDIMLDLLNRGFEVNTNQLGFKKNVALWNLKDGIYRLGIFLEENSDNSGLTWSDCYIIKQDGITQNYFGKTIQKSSPVNVNNLLEGEEIINFPLNNTLNSAILAVWTVSQDDVTYLQIIGWVYADGKDSERQKVYIKLEGENQSLTRQSLNTNNLNVARDFGEQYLESGFIAYIPLCDVEMGLNNICILVENEDGTSQVPHTFQYTFNLTAI